MPDPKGTKFADVVAGNSSDNTIRGRQGNDTLSGGGGNDTFVFEKSFKENGLDTITDYHWSSNGSDGLGQDVLDLTEALKAFKRALKRNPNTQISDYVRLEYVADGARLIVDTDGAGGQAAQQWALLKGVTASQVRVRAFTASASGSGSGSGADLGNGYYTLGNVLAITAASADNPEGNSGLTAFTFTVTRTGSGNSSANWAVSGIGSDPADAADFENGVFPSGTVSFSGSETSKTITIYVNGDTAVEKDKTFQVVLSAPASGTTFNPSATAATGIIRNDDSLLAIAATSADNPEGNSGLTAFTFTVTRTGSGNSSANWAVSGIGSDPADAADFENGVFPSGTVSFSGSETSKTITIYVNGDTAVENDKTFQVVLSDPATGTALDPSATSAAGTIRNDDSLLAIVATTAEQDEGNSGTTSFSFTVNRTGDTSGTSTATWAVSGGSGTHPADAADFDGATFPTGTVEFAAGETSKTITVNVNGDTAVEDDETFEVSLSAPSAGTSLDPAATVATGTIKNDDSAQATTIFVSAESGYPQALAWFDTNGNGTLDQSEVDPRDTEVIDGDYAYFGVDGNVDFANNSYVVEFIGISSENGFPPIDLSGFTEDDSLIVNFSKDWAGTDLLTSPTCYQRGAVSWLNNDFQGYTFNSYTFRTSSKSMATRIQGYSQAGSAVAVGVSINPTSLVAGFLNYKLAGVLIPGARYDGFKKDFLATWSTGTTISASQLSVVWPGTLAPAEPS